MDNIKLVPSLLVFAEVAQRKSFTEAAKSLGMSKSAVSQHVSRLEEQMGLQLLSRNTRGMSVTANGLKLCMRSEMLRDQVDLAFQELASAEEMPSGIFSITFPYLLEKNVITPALRQLCIEFPKIEPRIIMTDEALDLINDKLDVAIFAGDLPDSNYRALRIGTITEAFFASPSYLQKHGIPKVPEDLCKHRWVSVSWQNPTQTIHCSSSKSKTGAVKITLKPYVRSNSLSSIVDMAVQDMGLVLLSTIASAPLVQSGELVRVLENHHGKTWPFHFVHPFQGEKPIHVTRFHQLVRHFFEKASV
ncbi:MAG: LysR family transcriptional regulator [Rhizobiaceae bacterium]|nr:LysR family transcriptional regulator [Rhizobiaceae bacterium]